MIFLVALAALFFMVVLFFGFEAAKYTRMIGNIFQSLVYTPKELPVVSHARGEAVTIWDSARHETQILWAEAKGSSRVVIFCHESGSNKNSWERYAYFLPQEGYSVLSVDFEKESLSQWPTEEDVSRLVTVIRWAKKATPPDVRIFLFGVSNGADIAFAASFHDPAVKAVVADGLFSMKEVFRDYIRRWAPVLVKLNFFGERYPGWVVNLFTNLGFRYCQQRARVRFVNVEDFFKKPHVPLLMVHGQEDDYVPSSHQRFLAQLAGKKKVQHWVVPKAGHNEAVAVLREDYQKQISQFLAMIR
ncbi:MAG: alpha/beta hydrolase [Candidatus Omnitrophica bacterium]|nr:alpha/beta hydrolase [Candidatus Omnitrophota bacterium]